MVWTIQYEAFTHPYFYIGILSFVASTLFGIYAFKQREKTFSLYFSIFSFSMAFWAFNISLQMLLEPSIIGRVFYFLTLIAIGAMAWSWAIFVYYFTNDYPSPKFVIVSVVPVLIVTTVTISVILPNMDSLPIIRTTLGVDIIDIAPEDLIYIELIIIVAFLYSIPANFYLAWKTKNKNDDKTQYRLIVAASIVFLGGAIIDALQLHPYPEIHISPFAFSLASIFFWGAIYKHGFLNVLPIAREQVVKHMQQAVFVVNDERKIIDVNKPAVGMVNRQKSELQNELITDVLPELDEYGCTFTDEESISEFRIKQGEKHQYFNISITPLENQKQKYIGATILFDDVTKKTRQKKKIKETKIELEQQNTQLEQQKAELQKQNEQLEQFASVLSHDLRNPVSLVKGYSQMIEEAEESEDINEYLEKIQTGINRIDNMIDELLLLAQERKIIKETEPVELEKVAQQAWKTTNIDASLTITSSDEIQADAGRLQNVFENLYRNTVDHSDPGTDIEIYVGVLTDGDGFFIEDNGPGIPEEHQKSVFEYGKTFSDDGTGFGLAIVDKIIKAHEWRVEAVNGKIGDGARFEVYQEETNMNADADSVK